MNGYISTDESLKTRPVLADFTNQLGKGICSSNLESSKLQKDCRGYKNSSKDKSKCESVGNGREKGLSPLNVKRFRGSQSACSDSESLQRNPVSVISGRGGSLMEGIVRSGDGLKDGCNSIILETTDLGQCNKAEHSQSLLDGEKCQYEEALDNADVIKYSIGSNLDSNPLATHVCMNDEKGLDGDNLASNKSIPIVSSRPFEPCISKSFELERCTSLNGNGSPDDRADVDLLKSCSCSFCLKAAYIWSDLHYQDIKGQVAALKRSQKEVSCLVERSYRHSETDIYDQGNSKMSELELDLMGRWRSLYLHVEDVLARETTQRQSTLVSLKELRESCKRDLELTHGMHSNR